MLTATPALAQEYNEIICETEKQAPYVDPPIGPAIKATCELETGFGLIAIAADQSMFDAIQSKLAAG